MEPKYIIPDITTGEPIEVTKEVWETYTFLMDNIQKKDNEYSKLFKEKSEGFNPDKLLKIKKFKNGKI